MIFVELVGIPVVWPGSEDGEGLAELIKSDIPAVLEHVGDAHVVARFDGFSSHADIVTARLEGAAVSEEVLASMADVIASFVYGSVGVGFNQICRVCVVTSSQSVTRERGSVMVVPITTAAQAA